MNIGDAPFTYCIHNKRIN